MSLNENIQVKKFCIINNERKGENLQLESGQK